MEQTYFAVLTALLVALLVWIGVGLILAILCDGCSGGRTKAHGEETQAEIRALGEKTRREIDAAAEEYLRQVYDGITREPP